MSVRIALTAAIIIVAPILAAEPAVAQTFSQFYGFGDSTIDSGWYRNAAPMSDNATFNADFPAAVAAGGGKATTNPGQSSSEMLAGKFGLTAAPANTPGGTIYATGDARNSQVNTPATGGLQGAVPTATQIGNYLASTGGAAAPNALYLISTGGNDVLYAENKLAAGSRAAYVTTAGSDLVGAVVRLRNAGANFIVVPNQPQSFGAGDLKSLRALYNDTVWSGLAANGVNFIPADINAVYTAIFANPASFGFQFVSNTGTGPACTQPAGITSGWATLCSPTSPISTFVSPDAAQTHLFADNVHLTTAGQQIVADYEYSLIVAPSQISFLPEAQVQTRRAIVNSILTQIPLSQGPRGPHGFNAWIGGDLSSLKMSNRDGFPDDPGTPTAVTAGIDYAFTPHWIGGMALSFGTTKQSYSTAGNFRQIDYAVSLYAAYRSEPLWLNAVVTAGAMHFDVNRDVTVGQTTQHNNGSTSGSNYSAAVQAGYDVTLGRLRSGPLAGMTFQRVRVGAFSESGSFTSLSFGDQTRNSAVSEIGYQASYDAGWLHPFAKLAWNHELAGDDRWVSASLTTIAAPSYSMPAVQLGQDWGSITTGASMAVATRSRLIVALASEFARNNATSYGVQLGFNAAY
ncbi:MAG: autotransporter domain-containing protein [Proteobacteria bacterium]|nr:autotransporter domain-containing protein [Pseudomonadota bacterium]